MAWVRGLFLVLIAVLAAPLSAFALDGEIRRYTLTSDFTPEPVDVAVYLPPGYDTKRPDAYPLLIQLHGGGGSSAQMTGMAELLEQAVRQGRIPAAVSVMPSAGRSFYMDYRDGSERWESFVIEALLPHMKQSYNVPKGREGVFVTGVSMGGMGSLRIAFKRPDLFQAVAAQEPGIEPALAFDDIQLRDRFWRSDAIFEEKYGAPVDKAYWADNNPATIASRNPERLVGLEIYLEAGDQDMFFLHHGTEFLHRVLFDAGVAHEYRLVRGAEHVGPSIAPRFLDAMSFFGRVLSPPTDWTEADQVTRTRASVDLMKRRAGYPVVAPDPSRLRDR
ncbi:esterase [bacterium]|nr:esterase [bacterium]